GQMLEVLAERGEARAHLLELGPELRCGRACARRFQPLGEASEGAGEVRAVRQHRLERSEVRPQELADRAVALARAVELVAGTTGLEAPEQCLGVLATFEDAPTERADLLDPDAAGVAGLEQRQTVALEPRREAPGPRLRLGTPPGAGRSGAAAPDQSQRLLDAVARHRALELGEQHAFQPVGLVHH